MIDKNNLNRIKGILSAKKGAEIPKFQNPGGPLIYNAQDPDFIKFTEFSGDRVTPFSFRYYAALKSLSPNATPQQLAEQVTGQAPIPGNITISEAVSNYEKNKNTLNNSSNNSRSLIETEIPGAPILNPNSAVEAAAQDNQIEYMLRREDNIKNAALTQPITNTNIPGVTVPEPASINTDISQLKQKVQTKMKQEAESYGMNLKAAAAKKENWKNFGMQTAGTAVAAFEGIGDAIGAKQMATNSATTNMADSLYDTTAAAIEKMGPIGKIAGTAMKYAGIAGDMIQELGRATGERVDTDQMTATDKWMDSSFFSWNIGLINGAFGKNTQDFGINQSILSQVGSSYGGTISDFNEANEVANKRYGLFSKKKRREADNKIATAKLQQNTMANIADTATDQRNYVQSMGEQAGLVYSLMTDGGYNQKYTYAAKQGGLLEWNPTLEIEWEPQIEINWKLPAFKEGGNIDIVEELEWIPEFKDGGKTENYPEEYLKFKASLPPNQRDTPEEDYRTYLYWQLWNKPVDFEYTKTHPDEDGNYMYTWDNSDQSYHANSIAWKDGIGYFMKPKHHSTLKYELDWFNKGLITEEGGKQREMTSEERKDWEDFKLKYELVDDGNFYKYIPKNKKGGFLKENDIPETEETSQKNVIPEGALHKNKHHMEHAEGLTKKGIPVIDDNGEQQAEIEHSEIIFTLEVTKKLEEYYKIFYSDESSNKEKEQAALDAGKLLVYQILENTEDRTGLIESCKKGGTLTIKESEVVEDLLDWIPTIMIVEEIKEEIEEEKPKKKSELEKDNLKEQVKDVIREALIELLIK